MMRLAVALLLLLVAAPVAAAAPNVEIRRTSHGIPHIKARSYNGLGYGYGYAFAQDNLCEIAEVYVTVDAQRSRYFGPDGTYASRGNGTNPNNLNSDFFFQRVKDDRVVENLLAQAPPAGPLPEIRRGVRGYVAGYNAYLRETGVDRLPDPRCRGREWVRPITEMDVYRRFYQLALLASSGVAIDGIAEAQPPTPPGPGVPPPPTPPGVRGIPSPTCRCSATWAPTRSRSARTRAPAAACCSATRTSRGTGRSASTRPSSRCPACPTCRAPRCSACRSC